MPPPPITKRFSAAGGPVVAVVTVAGAATCRVDLVGPAGDVLAGGLAGRQPLTLRVSATRDAAVSLVLHPRDGGTLSWQADVTGARS